MPYLYQGLGDEDVIIVKVYGQGSRLSLYKSPEDEAAGENHPLSPMTVFGGSPGITPDGTLQKASSKRSRLALC